MSLCQLRGLNKRKEQWTAQCLRQRREPPTDTQTQPTEKKCKKKIGSPTTFEWGRRAVHRNTLKYRKKMSGCRICRSLNFLIHLQHFKHTRHHHTGRKRLKNKGVASALEQQAVPLPLFLFLFYSSITSHLAFTSRTPPSGGTGKWRSWPGISWTGHAKETATISLLFYLIVVRAVCIFTLHFLFYVLLSVSSSS